MNSGPNPTQINGDRNLFCPYYRDCLDHAAQRHWETWACFNCHHKRITETCMEGPFSADDSFPYYSLSPNVCLKL
jgi:hypothetical protein